MVSACPHHWTVTSECPKCLRAELEEALAEVERLRGVPSELPPRPPDGFGLPRYGIRWNGPTEPLSVPLNRGYWTPWHLAAAEIDRLGEENRKLELRWKAEMEHAAKLAARARKAESDFSYMNRIRDHLQGQVLELQRDRETACENTPTKGCECPGCCTARERAERGEA